MKTNKYDIPADLAEVIAPDKSEKRPINRYSITQLLGNVRENVLSENEDPVEDVSDSFLAFLGSCVHFYFQHNVSGGINEWKLVIPFKGNEIVGVIDRYDPVRGEITDYKTKKCGDTNYEDAIKQVKCYAWMLKQMGIEADKGRIVILRRDWSKVRNPDISPVEEISFKISALDAQISEEFIESRIHEYEEARKSLPECSEEDKWYTGTKWAVYTKPDSERAKKVFDDELEARRYAEENNWCVVERRGIYMKCENFCKQRQFCQFLRKTENHM